MEKIKKALTLLIAISFLCAPKNSFALRPPSHFSEFTEAFVRARNGQYAGQTSAFEQTISQFLEVFHPILHKAIEIGTEWEGISVYPYGCLTGLAACKVMLNKIYGNSIGIKVVEVKHPQMKRLQVGSHFVMIILDKSTKKKYFLSFFEGIWDDRYPFSRVGEVTFYDPYYRKEKRATLEYIDWFKKQNFPYVFFEFQSPKNITKLTGLTVIGAANISEFRINPEVMDYIRDKIDLSRWTSRLSIANVIDSLSAARICQ